MLKVNHFRLVLSTGLLLALWLLYPWSAQTKESRLWAGPMVGAVTENSAQLWVQTSEPTAVQFRYQRQGHPESVLTSPVVKTTADQFLTAQMALNGLLPGQTYEYTLLLNSEPIQRDYPTQFRTPITWKPGQKPNDLNIALGSCFYLNDNSPNGIFGLPYGSDFEIISQIPRLNPDLMLWLGDNIYFSPVDVLSESAMEERYHKNRAFPLVQPLLAMTANYAIWDDHDFGPDNTDNSFRFKALTMKLFRHYWANPTYGQPNGSGVFFHFSRSDVDFFMMDDRNYRIGTNKSPDKGAYWGKIQLEWLKTHLKSSPATFKVIANGNQFFNPYATESYSKWTKEYQDFIGWLGVNHISGIILLSGDRHHSELLKQERNGHYPLYDFTSSPLTSRVTGNRMKQELTNPLRVPGSLVRDQHNFGMLRFVGPAHQRVAILETYNKEGKQLWKYEISAKQLRD